MMTLNEFLEVLQRVSKWSHFFIPFPWCASESMWSQRLRTASTEELVSGV